MPKNSSLPQNWSRRPEGALRSIPSIIQDASLTRVLFIAALASGSSFNMNIAATRKDRGIRNSARNRLAFLRTGCKSMRWFWS